MRYELTGGFIKNAILSALSIAVSRDGETPLITQDDLLKGASLQLRGRLRMKVCMYIFKFLTKHASRSLHYMAGCRPSVACVLYLSVNIHSCIKQYDTPQKLLSPAYNSTFKNHPRSILCNEITLCNNISPPNIQYNIKKQENTYRWPDIEFKKIINHRNSNFCLPA